MADPLRPVVAGVILALFGGGLLHAVLTGPPGDDVTPAAVGGSPAPMTTDDLLSGMITEEFEPGVLRVVNDGYRDLGYPHESGHCNPWDCGIVVVGDSSEVWRARFGHGSPSTRQVYRLGREAEWAAAGDGLGTIGPDLMLRYKVDVDPAGRLWALTSFGPHVLESAGWEPDAHEIRGDFDQIEVQADGTIWLLSGGSLVRADETTVEQLNWWDTHAAGASELAVTDEGEVWLLADGTQAFLHYDGAGWELVPAPDGMGDGSTPIGERSDVSPGGVLWATADWFPQHHTLARLDEDGWTIYGEADGVQPWGGQKAWWNTAYGMLQVAPDGSAWVNATVAETRACDGLGRFDGHTWQSFLAGSCISDFDIAPDGSVWVVALDPASRKVGTYVITPEAVTAPAAAAAMFPEGEPIDLVFISDSSGSIVSERYAELVGTALDREVRLDRSIDKDAQAIRTTFADKVAGAEIIVFYINAGRFEQDMPAPTFERGCIDPVDALTNPDYLEDPGYLGPPWTPGTKWEPVSVVPTAEDWQPYRDFLSGIWEAIWEARDGQPVVLRGYDVYNPWFGQWVEIGVEPECTAIWEGQARVAREVAEANGAVFVSFYDLFNGPDHDEDARAKGWIGEDGFHANEAGGAAAAEALAAVGFELSEPPR